MSVTNRTKLSLCDLTRTGTAEVRGAPRPSVRIARRVRWFRVTAVVPFDSRCDRAGRWHGRPQLQLSGPSQSPQRNRLLPVFPFDVQSSGPLSTVRPSAWRGYQPEALARVDCDREKRRSSLALQADKKYPFNAFCATSFDFVRHRVSTPSPNPPAPPPDTGTSSPRCRFPRVRPGCGRRRC